MSALRVLIVEDNLIYAEALKCLLERACHVVVGIASQAREACALIRKHRPNLALVDLHLRDGLTGVEIGRSLVRAGIGVLFLTGTPDAVPGDLLGAHGVLTKPAGDARLMQAIEAVVPLIQD